jgi:hypothetical protein
MVNSRYWADVDEVAAFEELCGSHGGLGGGQSHPFVLAPPELAWPDGEVIGAEAVHRVFRAWLVELGHESYSSSEPPGAIVSTRVAEPDNAAANANGGSVSTPA